MRSPRRFEFIEESWQLSHRITSSLEGPVMLAKIMSQAFISLGLSLILSSCHTTYPYRVYAKKVHKDVIHCNVYVPAALDVEAYRTIANREAAELLAGQGGAEIPIYQIRFAFLASPGQSNQLAKVAQVNYELGAKPGARAVREKRIVVYKLTD